MNLNSIARRISAPLVEFNFDNAIAREEADHWYEFFKALAPNIVLYRSPQIYFDHTIQNPYDMESLRKVIVDHGYFDRTEMRKIKESDPIVDFTMRDFATYFRDDSINIFYTAHSNPTNAPISLSSPEWFAHDIGHISLGFRNSLDLYSQSVSKLVDEYTTIESFGPSQTSYTQRQLEVMKEGLGIQTVCAWVDPSQHPSGAAYSQNIPEDFLGDLVFDYVIEYVKKSGLMPTKLQINPTTLYLTSHSSKNNVALKPDKSTFAKIEPIPGLKPKLEQEFNSFMKHFKETVDLFFDRNIGKIFVFNQ
jgi:hypothetical protein